MLKKFGGGESGRQQVNWFTGVSTWAPVGAHHPSRDVITLQDWAYEDFYKIILLFQNVIKIISGFAFHYLQMSLKLIGDKEGLNPLLD